MSPWPSCISRRILSVCFFLAISSPAALAAIAPAGTRISSRSRGEFLQGSSGLVVYSNEATTLVSPLYRLALMPTGDVRSPAYLLRGGPADTLYCVFRLSNEGNARDSVAMDYRMLNPSRFIPSDFFFFYDANGDGIFQRGEDDRSFLALPMGGQVDVNTAIVLPDTADIMDSYFRVEARSTSDDGEERTSVVKATIFALPPGTVHIGPAGNPKALPGGEGSSYDFTWKKVSVGDDRVEFVNEVLNEWNYANSLELILVDTLPPGLILAVSDSGGFPLPRSPTVGDRFLLGVVPARSSSKVRLSLSSSSGPLSRFISGQLSLRLKVRSLVDTSRVDYTTDVVEIMQAGRALVSLKQTFRRQRASPGDVVTLVVTVKNLSDSVGVDGLVVTESVGPELDPLAGGSFVAMGRRLFWDVGTLPPGEERTAAASFIVNGRTRRGSTAARGYLAGHDRYGNEVRAGPVESVLIIARDAFSAAGVVMGEVFIDADADGRRDRDEQGVPGAAVYLESGKYAMTDSLGRFTLPRVFSGYRTVRLDETSLKPGLIPRGGRSPMVLVHMLEGGNAYAGFPLERMPAGNDSVTVTSTLSCQEKVSMGRRRGVVYRTLSIPSSYFATGKAYLRDIPLRELEKVPPFLFSHRGWRVLLEGHTDSIPIHTPRFPSNYELSLARAQAVARFLAARGVPEGMIVLRGYGESRPVASNATPAGRRLNRRVEVSLIPPGVEVSSGHELRRIVAELDSIRTRPDSLRVKVFWEITSSSASPLAGTMKIHFPRRARAPHARVFLGQKLLESRAGAYRVNGLSASHPLRIELAFDCTPAGTMMVGEAAALLSLAQVGEIELRPLRAGDSKAETRLFTIGSWREAAGAKVEPAGEVDPRRDKERVFGILEPMSGRVFSRRQKVTVQAVVPLGREAVLEVGGRLVPTDRVGEKVIDVGKGVEKITWYGVPLREGWNRLVLTWRGPTGTRKDTVEVALAGRPTAVVPIRKKIMIPADGRSRGELIFKVTDELGLPVIDGAVATVVEGDSLVASPDLQPGRGGRQVLTRSGRVKLDLNPSALTKRGRIGVKVGRAVAYAEVAYVRARALPMAAGIAELRLGGFRNWGGADPTGLGSFSRGENLDGYARIFLESSLSPGTELTLRLDSRHREPDALLERVRPDRAYPVYGDASRLLFAAPSRGGNYASLTRGGAHLSYGDFRTDLTRGEFLRYRRSVNGLRGRVDLEGARLAGFVTKTDFVTYRDEIGGDGTSGYYYLSHSPVVENSERVVVEVRDRYRPEQVISLQPMVADRNYTINYFDGALLFKDDIPVTDEQFNPVVVVVTYEVEGGRDRYLYALTGTIGREARSFVGFAALSRQGDDYRLYGFRGGGRRWGLGLRVEAARSENPYGGAGNAFKLEGDWKGCGSRGTFYLRRVDGDFVNPSFSGAAHELASRKAGFAGEAVLAPELVLKLGGYAHELHRTGESKGNLEASLEKKAAGLGYGMGVRAAYQRAKKQPRRGLLATSFLRYRTGALEAASRWEKNLGRDAVDDYPDRLRTSLSLPWARRFKVNLEHEYLSSWQRGASHQARLSLESRLATGTKLYSRYRMNRMGSDERLGAAVGLEQSVSINDWLSGTLSLEQYRSLSQRAEEYVVVKTGLKGLKPGKAMVEGRYEWRSRAGAGDKHLLQLDALYQHRCGLALFAKNALASDLGLGGERALDIDSRLSVTYRPEGGFASFLSLLRNDYARFTPDNRGAVTWKLIWISDVNLHVSAKTELRLKYGFKRVEEYCYSLSAVQRSDLVLSQFIYRFIPRWDVDLWFRVLDQSSPGAATYGAGVEVGRTLWGMLRLAAGYILSGLEEGELVGGEVWRNGLGLRVQLLLCERLLPGSASRGGRGEGRER